MPKIKLTKKQIQVNEQGPLMKQMTKAEIQKALTCFAKDYKKDESSKICENCSYIDFCWDLGRVIAKKPKKYI